MSNVIGLILCTETPSRNLVLEKRKEYSDNRGLNLNVFSIPKFALPLCDESNSLLSNWIHILEENNCNKIIIGVSSTNDFFASRIINSQFANSKAKIVIKLVEANQTMNETIIKCMRDENYDLAIMCMSDTYTSKLSRKLIDELINNNEAYVGIYAWNVRNTQLGKVGQCKIEDNVITDIVDKNEVCDYKYNWGSIVFKPEFEKYIMKENLYIEYSLKRAISKNKALCQIMRGLFFDCETIQGYSDYIGYASQPKPLHIKGTLIIVAVHINNNEDNYNQLINCLTQLRRVYQDDTIITVDNQSLNKKWHETAKELEFIILENTSEIHRYEIGAYKLALAHFRADRYIFLQGTILINHKFDLSALDCDKANAISLGTIHALGFSGGEVVLRVINKLLLSINMSEWNNEPLVLWCCFCANHLFIENMFSDGIFDLFSNTKDHSCAFERILGYYLFRKLNRFDLIPEDAYEKIWLNQI